MSKNDVEEFQIISCNVKKWLSSQPDNGLVAMLKTNAPEQNQLVSEPLPSTKPGPIQPRVYPASTTMQQADNSAIVRHSISGLLSTVLSVLPRHSANKKKTFQPRFKHEQELSDKGEVEVTALILCTSFGRTCSTLNCKRNFLCAEGELREEERVK